MNGFASQWNLGLTAKTLVPDLLRLIYNETVSVSVNPAHCPCGEQ